MLLELARILYLIVYETCLKLKSSNRIMQLVKNNYDDFCDINAETLLFCGLDYDEFIKTSLSFGPRAHTFKSMRKF